MTDSLTIVGIVSSAGGLEALSGLVGNLPKNGTAAFIVAQHMSPTHESLMVTLLARETDLPVRQAEDGDVPEAGVIYVTPPNADLVLEDGKLAFKEPSNLPASPKPSGDRLLKSLARELGERSMAVILSGTGSDGSYGVQAVREAGGITIAQDPATAKYDGMPNSAIETGCVDLTLSPQNIALHMAQILSNPRNLDSLRDEIAPRSKMTELMRVLLARTQIDFRDYKSATVNRRINRRMNALGITEYDDYVALCRGSFDEVDALHRDLLISVTRFFRDPEQFEMLGLAIGELVDRYPEGPFRVWVPGVATGEEAYSIAILFAEALGGPERLSQVRLQIFATDVDTQALGLARSGRYPLSAMQDVPGKLRDDYFLKVGDKVEVIREIRSVVLFSRHNVAQDPPFMHLNLVSLRNVLIYFNASLQERVLSRVHYGLGLGGLLFLGTSETASSMEALFEQSHLSNRLYVKRSIARRAPVDMARPTFGSAQLSAAFAPQRPAEVGNVMRSSDSQSAFDGILRSIAPRGFMATRTGDILRIFGDVSGYIELSEQTVLRMNLRLLRSELREEASNLIAISSRNGRRVDGRWHPDATGDLQIRLVCFLLALPEATEDLFVIGIEEQKGQQAPVKDLSVLSDAERLTYISEIEQEMQATREALQQTVEELRTSNEELQSANEELQSTNEELQATNEELETANEELQSTNEELITVNEEMRISSDEMHRLSSELSATFSATVFPTLMVDEALLIRHASRRALDFLGLDEIPPHGLHLSQCRLPEGLPSATVLCNQALKSGTTAVASVTTLDRQIQITVTPFAVQEIGRRSLSISIQETTNTALATMMSTMDDLGDMSHWMVDVKNGTLNWSRGVYEVHGMDPKGPAPSLQAAIEAYHVEDRAMVSEAVSNAIENDMPIAFEARLVRADNGMIVPVRCRGAAVKNAEGETVMIVGAFADISKQIEEKILIDHFSEVQDALGVGFYSYDIANDKPFWSKGLISMLGYPVDSHVPTLESGLSIIHEEDRERVAGLLEAAITEGKPFEYEARMVRLDGTTLPCLGRGNVRQSSEGQPTHVYGSFQLKKFS